MASELRIYKFEDLEKNRERDNCWLLIHGKVYDVTTFLEEHPGGDEVLLSSTGKDATGDFDDTGHSESAKELMNKYYIGDIDSSYSVSTGKNKYNPSVQLANKTQDTSFLSKLFNLMLPLLIMGIAFALRYAIKRV